MDFLKAHCFLKADASRFGRRDEAKMANEEDKVLINSFFFDTLQFTGKNGRKRVAEIDCERRGAHRATVVKLNLVGLIRRPNLTVPLQIGDYINERGVQPGLNRSLGLCGGDDVGSRFFDNAEPVEFQLTDDRRFACTWRAGNDESFHVVYFFKGTAPE